MNNPEIMEMARFLDDNPATRGIIKTAANLDREQIKNLILTLLSWIGNEELKKRIEDNSYNDFAKECIREELENRRKRGAAV